MNIKTKRRRLTKRMRDELHAYVRDYQGRGVIGTFWDLAISIQVALREIDDARDRKKRRRPR